MFIDGFIIEYVRLFFDGHMIGEFVLSLVFECREVAAMHVHLRKIGATYSLKFISPNSQFDLDEIRQSLIITRQNFIIV